MSMEKRGVCSGESEAPVAKEAEAKDCCGATCASSQSQQPVKKSCGDDLMSKMADEVCPLDKK